MGLINKRNALLGWTVWQVAKRSAAGKAKMAGRQRGSAKPGKRTIATGVATLGGLLWFLGRRRGGSDES